MGKLIPRHGAASAFALAVAATLVLLVAGACSDDDDDSVPESTASVEGSSPDASFSTDDPFEYCSEVGTIDAPDGRYTGEPVPTVIAEGIKAASGASDDAPLDVFVQGTSWRCMDGEVVACTVGANLPCAEHANASTTPTPEMTTFCEETPDSEFIPAAVTGRATIYEWRCDGQEAVAGDQFFTADAQGFIAEIWYRLEP